MRRSSAVGLVALPLFGAATAMAGDPPERVALAISYELPEGLTGCPGADEFSALVAARLGYDPFAAEASWRVAVRIEPDASGLRGSFRLERPEQGQTERTLRAGAGECGELATALALGLSVTVDRARREEPSAPPPPAAPRPAPSVRAPIEAPPRRADVSRSEATASGRPSRLGVAATAAIHAATGTSPGITGGAAAGVRVRIGSFSLGVEGRADLPTSQLDAAGTGARASLFGATVAPCAHLRAASLCAVGLFGGLRGEAVELAESKSHTSFYSAAGVRIGVELPLGETVALIARSEVLATLTRTTLRSAGEPIWATPVAAGTLGIGAQVDFR
jgi:hypothetical protein